MTLSGLVTQGSSAPSHMQDNIESYVQTCLVRQQDKVDYQLSIGLLEPLPLATRPWKSILMDLITALPKSKGCGNIIVFVECYSKYTTFIAAPTDCNAYEVARLFIKHIVQIWGALSSIINDRDPRFIKCFWTKLFKKLGFDLKFSNSFYL